MKAFLVAQMVANLLAMEETQVQSLGQEYPLEKGKAPDSNIPAWRIPRIEPKGWDQKFRGLSGRHAGEEEEKHRNRLV